MKTRFENEQSTMDADIAEASEQRLVNKTRELQDMKRRIREFYSVISYVTFADSDTAPVWVDYWLDYLLDGEEVETAEVPGPWAESEADLKPVDTASEAIQHPTETVTQAEPDDIVA